MTTRAPYSRAISQVRSVDPESTTTISSAQRTLSSTRPRFASSLSATIAMERVSGKFRFDRRAKVFSHNDRCGPSGARKMLRHTGGAFDLYNLITVVAELWFAEGPHVELRMGPLAHV